MSWSLVPFSDVMAINRRPYLLGPTEDADLVGMRWYGLGPFHRETKPAHRIQKKSHYTVRHGDVVYNKLFAWKGTFGIVPEDLNGMFVSDKFPTYELDTERVFPPYLSYYFRFPKLWVAAERLSKGSAAISKLTLNPPQFLELPLLLPPIEEQKKIAETLHSATTRLTEMWSMRSRPSLLLFGRSMSVAQEGRLLFHSYLTNFQTTLADSLERLEDILVGSLRSGPSFPVSAEGGGVAVAMPSSVGSYRFNEDKISYGVYDYSVPDKDLLQVGDILFSRGNKTDHVGTCAVYPGQEEPTTYANLFMRIRVDTERYLPQFVHYWLMTPLVRRHVRKNTTGTSPTVQKINSNGAKSIPFPVGISKDEQSAWVERLTKVRELCDQIETCAVDVASKLELLPHLVVNQTFAGKWHELMGSQTITVN